MGCFPPPQKPIKPLSITPEMFDGIARAARALPPELLHYHEEGDPTFGGTYACRVEIDRPTVRGRQTLLDDQFLFWDERAKRWGYPGSDQWYRGVVLGWIGPLARKLSA